MGRSCQGPHKQAFGSLARTQTSDELTSASPRLLTPGHHGNDPPPPGAETEDLSGNAAATREPLSPEPGLRADPVPGPLRPLSQGASARQTSLRY
ncbi:unnamed protein product [Lota lota]